LRKEVGMMARSDRREKFVFPFEKLEVWQLALSKTLLESRKAGCSSNEELIELLSPHCSVLIPEFASSKTLLKRSAY
jgi:hypothetical protein